MSTVNRLAAAAALSIAVLAVTGVPAHAEEPEIIAAGVTRTATEQTPAPQQLRDHVVEVCDLGDRPWH